jgi:hypothetical protein
MTEPLTMLVSAEPIRHPEDVARLRAILNARGCDASDQDIQWAYGNWSEDAYAASWSGMGAEDDDGLFRAVRERQACGTSRD